MEEEGGKTLLLALLRWEMCDINQTNGYFFILSCLQFRCLMKGSSVYSRIKTSSLARMRYQIISLFSLICASLRGNVKKEEKKKEVPTGCAHSVLLYADYNVTRQ